MPISLLKESDPLGWMDAVFVLFLAIQSYQDDVRMIMKGCVQWD